MARISIISTSSAANRGYQAVADLAAAAGPELEGYRVIGGHMVQLLIHIYPTTGTYERATTDADAGIDRVIAAGQGLHRSLLERGYTQTAGNHYVRADGDGELMVDLLVPHGTVGEPEIIQGHAFDAVPGLSLALSAHPLMVQARVKLRDGGELEFTVPVPDAEPALVLKALAWDARQGTVKEHSDLVDIASLMEIIHANKDALTAWGFASEGLACRGQRLDASRALHRFVDLAARGRYRRLLGPASPTRLAALITEHIPKPAKLISRL